MSQAGNAREQLLSRAFVGLADTLVDDYDIIDLLDRLVTYSVELLAADAAGILLSDSQRTLRVVASSSEDAELMSCFSWRPTRARAWSASAPDCR